MNSDFQLERNSVRNVQPVTEAVGTDVIDMPVEAEVRHNVDAEQADMVRGSDKISSKLRCSTGRVMSSEDRVRLEPTSSLVKNHFVLRTV